MCKNVPISFAMNVCPSAHLSTCNNTRAAEWLSLNLMLGNFTKIFKQIQILIKSGSNNRHLGKLQLTLVTVCIWDNFQPAARPYEGFLYDYVITQPYSHQTLHTCLGH